MRMFLMALWAIFVRCLGSVLLCYTSSRIFYAINYPTLWATSGRKDEHSKNVVEAISVHQGRATFFWARAG